MSRQPSGYARTRLNPMSETKINERPAHGCEWVSLTSYTVQ